MIVLGCDVGEHAALGLARDGIPFHAVPVRRCNTARGRAEVLAAMLAISAGYGAPDRIVIERPTRNPKSRIDDYATLCERAGEMVALCEIVFPGVPILRPFPLDRNGTKGWQSIKASDAGKDSKDRSRAAVKRIMDKALAEGLTDAATVRGILAMVRDSHDVADAVLIACFGCEL